MADWLVVGVGNRWRGDDAVGLAVAVKIAELAPTGITVATSDGEPTHLLELLASSSHVIVVDAAVAESEPGTITRLDVSEDPVPDHRLTPSTHLLGVASAIELGRALGTAPERLIIFAVEVEGDAFGEDLSPAVAAAVPAVVEAVLEETHARVVPGS